MNGSRREGERWRKDAGTGAHGEAGFRGRGSGRKKSTFRLCLYLFSSKVRAIRYLSDRMQRVTSINITGKYYVETSLEAID